MTIEAALEKVPSCATIDKSKGTEYSTVSITTTMCVYVRTHARTRKSLPTCTYEGIFTSFGTFLACFRTKMEIGTTMSYTMHSRRGAAQKSRKSHVRSRGRSRTSIHWEDSHTNQVEIAIRNSSKSVTLIDTQEGDGVPRLIYDVDMFGQRFGVVTNKSHQVITILDTEMLDKIKDAVRDRGFDHSPYKSDIKPKKRF